MLICPEKNKTDAENNVLKSFPTGHRRTDPLHPRPLSRHRHGRIRRPRSHPNHPVLGFPGRAEVPDGDLRLSHGSSHGPRATLSRGREVQLVDGAEGRGGDGVRVLSQVSDPFVGQQVSML